MNEENAGRVSEERLRYIQQHGGISGQPTVGEVTLMASELLAPRPATEQAGGEVGKTSREAGPGFECDWDDGEYVIRWDNGKFLHAFANGKVVVTDVQGNTFAGYTIDALASPPSPAATQSAVVSEALREALHFITNIDNAHPSVRKIRAALSNPGASQ